MDIDKTRDIVEQAWQQSITGELVRYIRIPAKSPAFDPDWEQHGYIEQAVSQIESWCRAQPIPDMSISVERLPGRTPLIMIDIAGDSDDCVLLYGHLDKQPEMTGWDESSGLGPWQPVLRDDKLYGRGGADDGYAVFASLTAIRAIKEQGLPHARCVVLIEACEESGSYDLPFHIDALADRIGSPSLVVCLDSGCGNYDQLWCTTSLRGMVSGALSVELLSEGVHSGLASGYVADGFRVVRQLLERVEDDVDGTIKLASFHVTIPEDRVAQAWQAAEVLGKQLHTKLPFLAGVKPISDDPVELILNGTWRPTLSITGAGGLPPLVDAGNVCRPLTAVKVSMRLPPTCEAETAAAELKTVLEQDPPYNARVRFELDKEAGGWNAPALQSWLQDSITAASQAYFGREACYIGEGGTIPFMGMLGDKFPAAQFLVTGVLGPKSNAHGPNEFLHIPTAKRLTCCVASLLVDHYREHSR